MSFRLLSYNIRFGGVGRAPLIAEVIQSIAPHLVIFQEATAPEVIEEVARATGMAQWGAQPQYSLGFASAQPVEHFSWHQPRGSKHAFLEVQPTGGDFRVFGLHLRSMFASWTERQRVRELNALLASIERHREGFHVLVGDFNALAPGERLEAHRMPRWIQALIWVSGRDIQRDTIQTMLDHDYLDGFRHCYPDDDGVTFPVWDPHLRLDYLFLPARHADQLVAMRVITEHPRAAEASDHYPLLSILEL